MKIDRYPFIVRPLTEAEGGGYACEFPDVPGCMGDGQTPDEAISDGRSALWSCLETLRQLGRDVPEPTSASGQWRIRTPKSLHQRLAARAKLEGVSLNTLAVSLLSESLARREPIKSAPFNSENNEERTAAIQTKT